MKIALVSTKCWPLHGGMQRYIFCLCNGMRDIGHEANIYARFIKENADGVSKVISYEKTEQTIIDGCKINVIGPHKYEAMFMSCSKPLIGVRFAHLLADEILVRILMRQLKRSLEYEDIIHYSGRPDEILYKAVRRICTQEKRKLYLTPHVHLGKAGSTEHDLDEYKKSDGIVALTNVEKDWLQENGVINTNIEVVSHASTVSITGTEKEIRRSYKLYGKSIVLFIGRKDFDKGYGLLLQSMKLVWNSIEDAVLIAAGRESSVYKEISKKYKHIIRDKRVLSMGKVSEKVKRDLLAASDILCLPSIVEAFGLVYLEAWTYGKPTVGINIPTVSEIHRRSGGGLIANKSPRSIADCIIRLLSDNMLYASKSNAARAFVSGYTWKDVAKRVESLYVK